MANHDELLSILQAHGQQFLSSFQGSVKQEIHSGRNATFVQPRDDIEEEEAEEEEWEGIRSESEAEEGMFCYLACSSINEKNSNII